MSWQQIKVNTTPEHSDAIETSLLNFGAVSISFLDAEDQAVFQLEPGGTILWEATVVVALFERKEKGWDSKMPAGTSVCVASSSPLSGTPWSSSKPPCI